MHDQLLSYAVQLVSDAPDPTAIRAAVLTLAGTVVATAGAVFVALRSPKEARERTRLEFRGDERYHQVLKARLADARTEAATACAERDEARARLAAYERFFWLHHMDPRKILTGDEGADNVRI